MLSRVRMHAWTCLMAQIINIYMRRLVPGAGAGQSHPDRAILSHGRARAWVGRSFWVTAWPFDPEQKGEWEHTYCAGSPPAHHPRRTPSCRTPSRRLTVTGSFCDEVWKTHHFLAAPTLERPVQVGIYLGKRSIHACTCHMCLAGQAMHAGVPRAG